jgi:hypothetical protein
MADLENQRGDGGLSEGTAVMVKTRFLKPIRGSKTLFFVFAEEKWKKILRGDDSRRFAEPLYPPLN